MNINQAARIAYAGTKVLEGINMWMTAMIDAETLIGQIELAIEYGADCQGSLDVREVHGKIGDKWVDISKHISDEQLEDIVKGYEVER